MKTHAEIVADWKKAEELREQSNQLQRALEIPIPDGGSVAVGSNVVRIKNSVGSSMALSIDALQSIGRACNELFPEEPKKAEPEKVQAKPEDGYPKVWVKDNVLWVKADSCSPMFVVGATANLSGMTANELDTSPTITRLYPATKE